MSEAAAVSPSAGKTDRFTVFAAVLILGSHLPLLAVHFQTLWRWKPHYQFLPLLLLGFAWLTWQRRPRTALAARDLRLANPLLLAGLAALAVGVLAFSPWLAAVAFVLSVGGLMAALGAGRAWRGWLPVWALLWLLVPPPLDWDEDLIRGLQSLASRGCSPVLDVLGLRHLVEGNVLVLPGRRLLVAEACSGVNSLFTLLIATALFVVAARRPLVRSLLLLAGSVFWAGLMNLLRVVTVALAQSWWGVNLSWGWRHETLGFLTVGLALLLVASTDRLLTFLFGPIELADEESRENPWSRAWNRCMAGGDPGCAATGGQAAHGIRTARGWANWAVVAGFALLAAVQLSGATLASFSATTKTPPASLPAHADLFRRKDLPQTVGDWTQVQYGVGDYDPTRNIGACRQIWEYQRDKRSRAVFSADYPFAGWHDLSVCYVAEGWRVVTRAARPAAADAPPLPDPYVEVEMVKADGEQGLLLFSLISPAGRGLDVPQRSPWQRITARFAGNPLSRWLPKTTAFAGRETTLQAQVFVSSPDPLLTADREAARGLFLVLRQKLMSAYTQRQVPRRP